MARFFKIEGIWINLDAVSTITYESDTDTTVVQFGFDESTRWFTGDRVADILNANNDINMYDKVFCRYMADKLKSPLSLIISKLDAILKGAEK